MLFPVGSLPPGPPIETKKALLLLDFQNDFVSPDGKLAIANVHSFISKLPALATDFRSKGVVIWCGTEFKQTRSPISPTTNSHCILLKQFLKDQKSSDEINPLSPSPNPDVTHDRDAFLAPTMMMTKYRCCIPGSVGSQYPDVLDKAIDEHQDLVLMKSHYSAFVDTPLLMHLRTMLITELYVCGSISNISVYATVLDAVCHGLQVTIVEDCLGYNDELCHVEAMRQMADDMGANGIDCQELQDDLAGLLGDVIREEDFPSKFQISLPPPARKTKSHTSAQQINDWIARLESENESLVPTDSEEKSPVPGEELSADGFDSYTKSESSRRRFESTSAEHSSPRETSASGLDTPGHGLLPATSQKSSTHPTSRSVYLTEQKEQKQSTQTRKRRPSHESSATLTPSAVTALTPPTVSKIGGKTDTSQFEQSKGEDSGIDQKQAGKAMLPKKKKKLVQETLGPEDRIGQGDSQLYINLLNQEEADAAFYACKASVRWQKMLHRSGEVPRLVAVQGDILDNGTQVPIYRHPADELPELLPFDPVVDKLRNAAEKVVNHPLNHALIQWYRNSEDNISEHSDKSLDIVRGSTIVNLSLGARRTMILRTKKSAVTTDSEQPSGETIRPSQRIHLPHNSLFVLGPQTNQHWLHAIRADKRLPTEKDPTELAFDGERISLTFRHIGTFIDPNSSTIWGQGATAKDKEAAATVISGPNIEKEAELLIRAFGQENHRSTDWDWSEWYGKGFNVVNFETKPA